MGVGLASKVKLAGDAVKDTKKIVDALKAVASRVRVTNVSTARAILCVRAASDILTEQTAKAAIKTAAQGLTEGQIDELWGEVGSTFSFGVSNVFVNAQKLSEVPTFDSLAEFLASFAESAAHLGEFVTTCGSVLREFGVVALPSIARYAERFGTLCVASGIVSCGASLIGNTRDVAKELSCLGKDLDRLREQFAKLQDMNDANCANLGRIAENPSLLPVLRNGGTAQSEALAEVCSQTIRYWGSCVYDARRSGLFGSTRLSCSECERVCTSYVNAAGPNAYLGDVIDGALSRAGGSSQKVRTLVFQASQSCGPNVGPDGLKPCVHFCRGQVADCP
ncbi:MAG: hypothetical protein U0169_07510 [Polyangiaceae bacterium]